MILKGPPAVLILNRTTLLQLQMVRDELIELEQTIKILWNEAQLRADCTDQINPDIDNLYSAVQNILEDLKGLDTALMDSPMEHEVYEDMVTSLGRCIMTNLAKVRGNRDLMPGEELFGYADQWCDQLKSDIKESLATTEEFE